MVKNVGIKDIESPKKECSDSHCPFHSTLKVHGRTFEGTVKSDKMSRTVSVVWDRIIKVPKYNRYLIKRSKVKAHNTPCINAHAGDKVIIGECRPISKTKKFVVLKVINKVKKSEVKK